MKRIVKFDIKLKVTWEANVALMNLDKRFVGTRDYMGIVYFWDTEYKHFMRDNSRYWVDIHNDLLDAGLDVGGVSDKHHEIIYSYRNKPYAREGGEYINQSPEYNIKIRDRELRKERRMMGSTKRYGLV